MVNYISRISPEDVMFICDSIPAREFRKLFQKYSSAFSEIKPGYRPQTLSDDDAVKIAKDNIEKGFIHNFLNSKIDSWLKKISQQQADYTKQGYSEDKALVLALNNSVFCEKAEVYLHLSNTAKSKEYTDLLQASLEALNEQTSIEPVPENKESEGSTNQNNTKKEKEKWIKEKESLTKQNKDLRDELSEANKNIEELNRNVESLKYSEEKLWKENEDLNKRSHKAHTVNSAKINDEFPYASLCIVHKGYSDGKFRLNRLADIEEDTILEGLNEDIPTSPPFYENDGPEVENYLGIWSWNVGPNKNDPDKKFYTTSFNLGCSPIEVLFLSSCSSPEDIIKSLISGITGGILSDRIMFACKDSQSKKYIGILCKSKELTASDGNIKIADSIISLPQYCFSIYEILSFKERYVFRKLDIGIPDAVIYVKDKLDIVKEKVLSRASWTALKKRGMTKNEYKGIRDFLSDLPEDELSEEIAESLDCSAEEAQTTLSEFIDRADKYLNGQNIENKILEQVVRNEPELIGRCKELLSEDWKTENAGEIAEAETNLKDLQGQISAEKQKQQALEGKYSSQKEQYDKLLSDIDRQEQLAGEVEKKVQERIENAQKDAAEFIANQAFIPSASAGNVIMPEESVRVWENSTPLPEDKMEELNNWGFAVDLISDNLITAGVSPKYSSYLAAYLYAAYADKTSVLLIGPNGKAIADAFTASIFGETAAVLHCGGKYNPETFHELEAIPEQVILTENVFAPQWHDQIINFIQDSGKFVIATVPYAEDILIEPKGILNYWMPVITELFVDNKPSGDYSGGMLSDDYEDFILQKTSGNEDKFLKTLSLSSLAKSRLRQLMPKVSEIAEDDNDSMRTLFFWTPYAYILEKLEDLNAYLDENNIDKEVLNSAKRYIGDTE